MTKWRVYLGGLGLWLVMCACFAATDLYRTQINVSGESELDQKMLINQAYKQVLVKVAGNRAILKEQAVVERVSNAQAMVTEFRLINASDGMSRLAEVRFDPAQIQDILMAAGQEVWVDKRPAMILWLVNADPNSDIIYHLEHYPKLQQLASDIDIQRGISLVIPLLDLEDRNRITAQNIRQLDIEAISKASERYDTPLQLIGKIQETNVDQNTRVTIDWYLIQDFSRRHYSTSHRQLLAALHNGLEEAIDNVAHRYIHKASNFSDSVRPIVLTVSDIKSIDHYTNLLHYLQQLDIIKQIEVKHIGQADVTLQMGVMGGRLAFVKMLADNQHLKPLKEGGALDSQNLRYQLVA